jgi:RNA polymerase sigma-70 factor (ECF subfamily)
LNFYRNVIVPISPPETRGSLILRLQDAADVAAWDEFTAIYAPVVYRSARRMGLQAADSDDCVQEVLSAVSGSVTEWLQRDDRGAFRSWLFRIARNTSIDYLTRRKHRPWAEGGDTAAKKLNELAAKSDALSHLDVEYRREVFQRSSEIVREKVAESTWQAFYRTGVLQQSVQDVARELDMSPGSVYIARSRVMKQLQQVVKSFSETSRDEV